jgi:membrane protease YdiL (CAAX protease family)
VNRAQESQSAPKWSLAAECLALFTGVPAAYVIGWLRIPIIVVLLIAAGGCWLALRLQQRIEPRDLIRCHVPKTEWRRVLATYALAVPLLAGLLWLLKPEALFSLMSRNPKAWMFVMIAYPLVSVIPQELVYRVFFFDRYQPLFGSGIGMVFASAVVFSYGHIAFRNWPAVALTFFGGLLFARTYQRTSSLMFVAIEHALYGCALFTLGFGEFLLDGTLRLFR